MVQTSSCEREQVKTQQRCYLHSGIAGLVDNYRFPSLIHIVIHPKVSCHSVHQHPLVGRHLRELFIVITGKRKQITLIMTLPLSYN